MDLFTAKKLTALRKYHSLSQEALAEKAGVSRQAVSKWERCEASPDTDNMLTLSKIYSVSVDDLLGDKTADMIIAEIENKKKEEEAVTISSESPATVDIYSVATKVDNEKTDAATEKTENFTEKTQDSEPVSEASLQNEEINTPENIPVLSKEEKTEITAPEKTLPEKKKRGSQIRKKKKEKTPPAYPGLAKHLVRFPFIIVAALIFVALGLYGKMWHPGWLVFLTVPAYYLTAFAFFAPTKKKILKRIPVYYFAIALYLTLGILGNLWAHAWFIFLFIPIYYWAVSLKKDKS